MGAKKKILTLGDIHGRDRWKFFTHGSPYEFTHWKTAVENGAPGYDDFWNDLPYMSYEKIIFVGDYVDAFKLGNQTILENLQDIIFFKKALGDRVILLLGNHDIQYFVPNNICSGYRGEMEFDLRNIFTDKEADFRICHFEEIGGRKMLWTHAGVTKEWFDEFLRDIRREDFRFKEFFDTIPDNDIQGLLEMAWETRTPNIFNVDNASGGYDVWGGPFWVRPHILNYFHLPGYDQIVGHTPQAAPWEVKMNTGEKHHFIDCLFDDCYEVLEIDYE
jgi:hypothetical protein